MERKNEKLTNVDNLKICDVLRDVVPFREFYSGIIADSLNDITTACGVNLGDIAEIEVEDHSFNVEELGPKQLVSFNIKFKDSENSVIVTVGRTNLVKDNIKMKKNYFLRGKVDSLEFNATIVYDIEGRKRVNYEVQLSKDGLHYRMKRDKSLRRELVKFSMTKDGDVPGSVSKEGKYILPVDEFSDVISEIDEFRENPERKHLKVKGRYEYLKNRKK